MYFLLIFKSKIKYFLSKEFLFKVKKPKMSSHHFADDVLLDVFQYFARKQLAQLELCTGGHCATSETFGRFPISHYANISV